MFKVEAAVRIGLTSAACTSEACRYLFINLLFELSSVLLSNKEKIQIAGCCYLLTFKYCHNIILFISLVLQALEAVIYICIYTLSI